MRKSLLIASLVVFAAFVLFGCGGEAIKKLTEEVGKLTAENMTQKMKIDELEKAKNECQSHLASAKAKAAAAAAAPAPAADDKKDDKGAAKGGAKKDAGKPPKKMKK